MSTNVIERVSNDPALSNESFTINLVYKVHQDCYSPQERCQSVAGRKAFERDPRHARLTFKDP